MGSTKIINVLKDDRFEELLNIVRETDASEIIFVLPKNTKAFGSEEQFAILDREVKKIDKTVAFLCSNPKVNDLVQKYKFDVLSTANANEPKAKISKPTTPWTVVTAVSSDNSGPPKLEDESEENLNLNNEQSKDLTDEEDAEGFQEEGVDEREEDKEPLYGTETDESGETIYDEKEEGPVDQISTEIDNRNDFQVITARTKTDGKPIKVKIKKGGNNIKNILGSLGERSRQYRTLSETPDNIWSDIIKPSTSKSSILNKFTLYRRGSKRESGLNYIKLSRNWTSFLSIVVVLILILTVYLTTGNAKVEIKPRAHELNTQFKVQVSSNFSSVDALLNKIPGQLFTINKAITEEFNATAEKDAAQKSRGTITIYNEYSTSPQPLVATTRFEFITTDREARLVFRTLKTISVPGMKVENGVVSPGKITVEVVADKAGQNYNVPAGKFGIVSWREKGDTARYQKIYGQSDKSMHGGILGKAKVVSEFDYENAKNLLISKVKAEINESLRSQSTGLEIIDSVELKIDSVKSTAEADDAADSFSMTIESSLTTVGFKNEDLLSLVSQYIDNTNDLMIVPEKLELSYKNAVVNSSTNTLETMVVIKGNGYGKINTEEIADNLRGKNEAQIKEYFNSFEEEIDSAKVILSPFWVKKIPKNKEKISIFLTF